MSTTSSSARSGVVAGGMVAKGAAASPDAVKKREVVVQGFEKKSGLGKRVAEELECGVFSIACPNGEPLVEGSESFKTYKLQYKRLCTHLRQNRVLVKRLSSGELVASKVAAMDDKVLMADTQRSELEQFRQENLHEALGIAPEDSAHWTPSDNYTCPECEGVKCIYIQSFKGSHSYDDNNQEPAITIRCTACKHLWKEDEVEGGRVAAGNFVEPPAPQARPGPAAKRKAEAPSIWGEGEGMRQRAPTWLLPASG